LGRYYVLIPGSAASVPYVVAEVVSDPGDDGSQRESSLAGDIAGPAAMICTRDELETTKLGRRALRAWREGNDSIYALETLAMAGPTSSPGLRASFRWLTKEERHQLMRRVGERSSALRQLSKSISAEHQRQLATLRASLEEMRLLREALRQWKSVHGTRIEAGAPRRHLRSVS